MTGSRSVLVVDDNPGMWLALKLAIRRDGRFAAHGPARTLAEAVQMAPGCAAAILDLNLPDSRGPQTAEAFRRHCPDIPIVLYTGDVMAEQARPLVDAVVDKGQIDALMDALDRVTGTPGQGAPDSAGS